MADHSLDGRLAVITGASRGLGRQMAEALEQAGPAVALVSRHAAQLESVRAGIVYVADRENGRVQLFDLQGKYLGEWNHLCRVFSLKLSGNTLWLATQPLDLPVFSPGWLLKLDPKTGRVFGHVNATGAHGMDALRKGELFFGPGPNQAAPQWLRPAPTAPR